MRAWCVALVPMVVACVPEDQCGVADPASPLEVLDPLDDAPLGDVLPLVRGPQGLQHVEVVLVAQASSGVGAIGRARVSMDMRDATTCEPLQDRLDVGAALTDAGEGSVATAPLVWVVPEPGDVVGRDAVFSWELQVVGSDAVHSAVQRGQVQWDEGETVSRTSPW